jgi:integrase
MKKVEGAVPFDRHYTYYAARHTYASLARNVVGIDKYTVHELLNHSDSEMKITDRYIERDWQRLFDAHAKVVRLVDWRSIVNV